jgi:hypothetical protein
MSRQTHAILILMTLHQQPAEPPLVIEGDPAAAAAGWVVFRPTDGAFQAAFPHVPEQRSRTAPTSGGRRVPIVSYEYESPEQGTFIASFTDYPAGTIRPDQVEALYDSQLAGLAGRGGRLVRQRQTQIEGHPGRDFEVIARRDEQELRMLVRAVIVGDRAYQLMWVGSTDIDRDEAEAFLDSFRPKSAP